MKKLKKMLLMNWLYYSRQIIELDDINFLTGKTGAGKSTVVDALQIILLGEWSARNFNKAANESSQRTLEGYLRADIDGNNENSRRGRDFTSYIACEFFDDVQGTSFTLGIVFDCRADGSIQPRFFSFSGKIPEDCFTVSDYPMEIPELRAWLNNNYRAYSKMYDSQKEYRADVLAKWNVHTEQVFGMLKKAVSFRPIVDIRQFITENICDVTERPDIQAMQQNIREYKRHEEIAARQEQQVTQLQEISALYQELQRATDTFRLHQFLIKWAQREDLSVKAGRLEKECHAAKDRINLLKEEIQNISGEVGAKESRRDSLIADRAGNETYQSENRLRAEKLALEKEQLALAERLNMASAEIRREAQFVISFCETVTDRAPREEITALQGQAEGMKTAFYILEECGPESFSWSEDVFQKALDKTDAFSEMLRKTVYELGEKLSELQRQIGEKEAVLQKLRKNIKDYPAGLTELRDRLCKELAGQIGKPVSIEILADVLEVAEGQEAWRGVIEGYLNTQKFYLLVEPAYFEKALRLYNEIKSDYRNQSFGLVDSGKLKEKETVRPWEDSLAGKVATEHPLARDYIDYLLGHVVCCSHVSQLRKHRIAVTEDGMLYQAYVSRPIRRALMEDVFIGRRATEIRKARLEDELEKLRVVEQEVGDLYRLLDTKKNHEWLFTHRYIGITVPENRNGYLRGLEITDELKTIEEELSGLDLFWLNRINEEIRSLEAGIARLRQKENEYRSEIGQLQERLRMLEYETLPEVTRDRQERESELQTLFSEDYCQQIGLKRYEQELKRLGNPSVIARNFGLHLAQTETEQRTAKEKLLRARTAYVQSYQPCSFDVDAEFNGEFDAERKLLEESKLPEYREKIKAARTSALEQFQNDFLYRLQSSIHQVQDQVRNLNKALRYAQFGSEQYQFRVERNPDYGDYYDMIMSPELMEGDGLFTWAFQEKYSALIEDLFGRIATSDDTQLNARRQSELQQNIERYTDFRTYLTFDLETTDRDGNRQLLSQTLNKKSGGETQTPFYIAVLASFAQLYQVNNRTPSVSNTVRLVVFDEAFNKMDSDRIRESVHLLRKMNLQAIICTPPDKIADMMPVADRTLLVQKGKASMTVIPWSTESADKWKNE